MKFMVLLLFSMSIVVGIYLKVSSLYDFPILAVMSVWCQLNKDRIVPFEFGIRLKAQYLPWAICLSRFMLGGNGKFVVIGVLVGYAYFYLKFGEKILKTPQFFKWFDHWFVTPDNQGRPGGVTDEDIYTGRGARAGADLDRPMRSEGIKKRVGKQVKEVTNGNLFSGQGLLVTPDGQIKGLNFTNFTNTGRRNRLKKKTEPVRPDGSRDNN